MSRLLRPWLEPYDVCDCGSQDGLTFVDGHPTCPLCAEVGGADEFYGGAA
jgi:hypothetical protein